MSAHSKSPLVGVWEQVGTLHPTLGTPIPWPKDSLNASVREFFCFFDDGAFRFFRRTIGRREDEDRVRRRPHGHFDRHEAVLAGDGSLEADFRNHETAQSRTSHDRRLLFRIAAGAENADERLVRWR